MTTPQSKSDQKTDVKGAFYCAIECEIEGHLPTVYWCPDELVSKYLKSFTEDFIKVHGITSVNFLRATEADVDAWMKLSKDCSIVREQMAAVKIQGDSHFRGLFDINPDPVPAGKIHFYVHDELSRVGRMNE